MTGAGQRCAVPLNYSTPQCTACGWGVLLTSSPTNYFSVDQLSLLQIPREQFSSTTTAKLLMQTRCSLPVDDDGVGRCFVTVPTAFLVTATATMGGKRNRNQEGVQTQLGSCNRSLHSEHPKAFCINTESLQGSGRTSTFTCHMYLFCHKGAVVWVS